MREDVPNAAGLVEFSAALEAVMRVVAQANRYIEPQAPWNLAKQTHQARLHSVLNGLAEIIRIVAIALEPFTPSVAHAMWQQLGCGTTPRRFDDAARWPGIPPGQHIGTRQVLFPRMEVVG